MLPEEVMAHSSEGDVWVSVFGRVLDVSDLASPDPAGPSGLGGRLLFALAGKDVSHWFEPDCSQVATFVHPSSGAAAPLWPVPTATGPPGPPWWRDPARVRGLLTARPRPIRIVDALTGLQVLLSVCSEDSLARVLQRCDAFDSDEARYECVRADDADGRPLDRSRTLLENGIEDERDLFVDLGLPEDLYVPALMLVRRDSAPPGARLHAPGHQLPTWA
ncbi:hypothetical protein ONE63_008392 [Megalurothrips usitatus]|uniref:Cytochrome b5 domain-containing protein 1 n=1 Tax=Megalurothrips usitatus TaxID=439358 RepID=A0AAV7XQ44_9NEOP|nr:hypothetical protein ONE63_008392 [Megalurothrips usitatus]